MFNGKEVEHGENNLKKTIQNNYDRNNIQMFFFSDNLVYITIESAAKRLTDSLPNQVGYFLVLL